MQQPHAAGHHKTYQCTMQKPQCELHSLSMNIQTIMSVTCIVCALYDITASCTACSMHNNNSNNKLFPFNVGYFSFIFSICSKFQWWLMWYWNFKNQHKKSIRDGLEHGWTNKFNYSLANIAWNFIKPFLNWLLKWFLCWTSDNRKLMSFGTCDLYISTFQSYIAQIKF